MRFQIHLLAVAATLALGAPAAAAPPRPTVVLVHGAFADSSSWDGVVAELRRDGYAVIAAANPLRSLAGDAEAVGSVLRTTPGPVVLVGHSYGGSVISVAAAGAGNVNALVYVSAFAPDAGETSFGLAARFPGSSLGAALGPPAPLAGGQDLYIRQDRFPAQFAADVPRAKAELMAVAQRPITQAAGDEPARAAAWRTLPSWWIYGASDRNIPPAAMAFMAKRAHARNVVVVPGASHVVMVSHPHEVAGLIKTAAAASQAEASR